MVTAADLLTFAKRRHKTVSGPTLDELDAAADAMAELVARHVGRVTGAAARQLGGVTTVTAGLWAFATGPSSRQAAVSADDVGVITDQWSVVVDEVLVPAIVADYTAAYTAQQARLAAGLSAEQAALFAQPVIDVAEAAQLAAAEARPALVGIGDVVWANARTSLTEGMAAGESIPKLAARVQAAAGVSAARATVIARTESMAARNRGAYDEMTTAAALGIVTTKTWQATHDARTRLSHVIANGQTVPFSAKFTVGGWPADHPHDVLLPAEERISCRCTLTFGLSDEPPTGVGPDRLRAAQDRQADIDQHRPTAKVLGDVAELENNGASPQVIKRQIRSGAAAHGLPNADRDRLLAVVDEGHAVGVENRIREAYRDTAASSGRQSLIPLADIRDRLPEFDRSEVDAALIRMARTRGNGVTLTPNEDRKNRTRRDREAALRIPGYGSEDPNDWLTIDDPSPRPDPLFATVRELLDRNQITQIGEPGVLVGFDPKVHELVAGAVPAGSIVEIIRPGYSYLRGYEVILLAKAVVAEASQTAAAALLDFRRYVRDEHGQFAPVAGRSVADLPRGPVPSVGAAAKGTNPHYGSTNEGPTYRDAGKAGQRWTPGMGPPPSGAYEENCTNTVMAFEMRMRGHEVTAAPMDVLDRHGYAAGRTYKEIDDQVASQWRLPNGRPHGRSFSGQRWRSFDEVDREVQSWPEGGRGYMFTGKHVFSVVKKDGKAQYVEPQFDATPSRIVTRQYRAKYRDRSGLSAGREEEAKVIRLDDLVPTDAIFESVSA